jgi:hypothetical protein
MGFWAKLTGKATPARESRQTQENVTHHEYRGVSVIAAEDDCCQAARDIIGKRYLTDEAPRLPLSDCDAAVCRCKYKRFDERREDLRRSSDIGFDPTIHWQGDENRSKKSSGRRSDD